MDQDMFHDEYNTNAFGGIWTEQKLVALKEYLSAFTKALKNQHFKLIYLDGFAGTGSCEIKIDGETKNIEGSAKIALKTKPPFDHYYFIELAFRKQSALRRLVKENSDRNVDILDGDCNQALIKLCETVDWKRSRAVLFLDPYGFQVEWSTLKAIANTKAIDMWYLFPYAGLYRQAPKDVDALDSDKEAAINRILGTEEWRKQFYRPSPQQDLFGKEGEVRGSHQDMLDFVTNRLKQIFPCVLAPAVLYQGNNSSGAPLFALYFAVSNPNKQAQTVATRIAKHILRAS